jgi:hypothetical protein
MNLDPRFVALGIAGIIAIVGAAGWYFLAPTGRRPKADTVRRAVRERMQPVMFADTLPAARTRLDVPPSAEVVAHATGRPVPAWAGPTRVAIADRVHETLVDGYDAELEAAAARERMRHGLTPDGHVSVESRYAALDAAGWTPGTDGNGLPAAVEPDGQGATADWSPKAVAELVGQSDDMTDEALARAHAIEAEVRAEVVARLDAADAPPVVEVKGIDDFTDDELDDARWAEEFRRLDGALAFASWTFMANIAESCGPAAAVDILAAQHRAEVRRRNAIRQAAAWATGEGELVGPRKRPPTPAQAKRARKHNNRALGRADRILAEVGA